MTAAPTRPMRLGLFLQGAGHHVAGWRHPEAEFGGENLGLIQRIAATAEAGKFDLLFLADGLTTSADAHPSFVARLEPMCLLSALAMGTKHLGLAATMSTTYAEPFHVARVFASLDHLSGGRAAWNAVTTSYARSSANFSRGTHPPHDERYAIAEEFLDVVRGLWDSFADNAFLKDKASGVYVDPARVHTLNHEGKYFSVKGPLNVSRPPQGHPVVIQAGSSGPGQRLAARTADLVFTAQQTFDEGRTFRDGLRRQVAEEGRNPDHLMILPGVCPVIGATEAEAKALYAQLQGGIDPAAAILLLSDRLGHDISGYDLDGPLPNLPQSDQLQSRAKLLTDLARRENLTLRELYYLVAGARGHRIVWGTPEQVADALTEWFVGGASDGFNIMPPFFPGQFERFVEDVVPILQQRGLARTEYTGATLRENLGLPRPENPFFPR
ncbi:LLM class flavin-dependent oxidoreductase [Plastoroseomonas hellenica]|uniref:LLM class flavin-dependent oxidoreductase n=1 Tax=Plastoroseomonas hellenica TaxID=2687306 RepID=UPI001BA8AC9D|nr:LLM class flavin-dependent oxidoreductase [Plastoroseomonas hellenica]MBR0643266.1 LLM class flavin-dependent oxidoreductase [Plastoroseomonas hellenica]